MLERRVASPSQAASDLAVIAASQALASVAVSAADIGLIIVGTSTPDRPLPSTACIELMQILGHSGYERTQPHERRLRDAVAIRIAGGTTEMQKKNIFKDTAERFAYASTGKQEGTQ